MEKRMRGSIPSTGTGRMTSAGKSRHVHADPEDDSIEIVDYQFVTYADYSAEGATIAGPKLWRRCAEAGAVVCK